MEKQVLLLSASAKNKNLCVAGLDLLDRRLIRLVSDDKDTDGAIPKYYMQNTQIGDVVDISVVRPLPNEYQPENFLIDLGRSPRIQDHYSATRVIGIMKEYSYHEYFLLGNHKAFLTADDMKNNYGSLAWVHVNNVSIHLNERHKTRADFDYNGYKYENVSVTDWDFFDIDHTIRLSDAYFLMSLPHTSWCIGDGVERYYKFVAKIFPTEHRPHLSLG